jgi:hypothetical protein
VSGDADAAGTKQGSSQGGEPASPESRATPRAGLTRLAKIAALALFVLACLCVRVVVEGRGELEAAEAAGELGRFDDQVLHLGRAARWRMPLAAHDDLALEQLMELGDREAKHGPEGNARALAAYREARRAILATRAWGMHERDTFDRANEEIAALMAVNGSSADEERYLEQLAREPGPPARGAKFAAFTFILWLVASAGFATRGLDGKGRLRPRPARRWGGASLLLLVVWMVLMRWPELLG